MCMSSLCKKGGFRVSHTEENGKGLEFFTDWAS